MQKSLFGRPLLVMVETRFIASFYIDNQIILLKKDSRNPLRERMFP